MPRFEWIACVLVFASPALGQEDRPRLDAFGDPLPAGALRRFGTTRFRQDIFVNDMAFMPDGKSIVVLGNSQVVQWDVATGKPLRIVPVSPQGNRQPLGLGRDGRLLAVRSEDNRVVVVDMANGKERLRPNVGGDWPGGVISPDSSVLAVASSTGVTLFDLKVGKPPLALTQTEMDELKFSPDGKRLAGFSRQEKTMFLFDVTADEGGCRITVAEPIREIEAYIRGFEFSPDGKFLVMSSEFAGVLVYETATRKLLRHIKSSFQHLAISPDGKELTTVESWRTIVFTKLETGEEIRRWQVEDRVFLWARGAFSPDGKRLAVPFYCGIQLRDAITGKRIDPFDAPIDSSSGLALADDGKTIAVQYGSDSGNYVLLLDTETLKQKGRMEDMPHTLEVLSFSPDGRRLALRDRTYSIKGSESALVRLMDTAVGKERTTEKQITRYLSHWKTSDTLVVSGVDDASGENWFEVDADTGKERNRIPNGKDVRPFAFGPKSSNAPRRTVVKYDSRETRFEGGNQFYLAEWPSGRRIRPIMPDNARLSLGYLPLSPDERLIPLGITSFDGSHSDSTAFIEAATGRERFRLDGHHSIQFSPDGNWIVIRDGLGKNYWILDAVTFEPVLKMDEKRRCALSANGKVMVTSEQSSLLVWDAAAVLRRKTSSEKLTPARLEELWTELRNENARVAHGAMVAMVRRPDEAAAFLRSRLPDAAPDEKTFARLVRDLDGPDFKSREAAQAAIAQMGNRAVTLIRQSLKNPPSLEAERRLSTLLSKLEVSDAERPRWLRTSELLERMGTPQARTALELLRGFADPEIAADATQSLERLANLGR
jgi:WD40 repeat protein